MKNSILALLPVSLLLCCSPSSGEEISLPKPKLKGEVSLEEALYSRRCVRSYEEGPITLEQVSQLLWAACGLTIDALTGPTRAYPSAGGLYPLEVFAVVGEVESLKPGIYRYDPFGHRLLLLKEGDHREALRQAALGQSCISDAPLDLVLSAVYPRTTRKYGERGQRYVLMDLGGAAQNIFLQAESLGLGTVIIGAFFDEKVRKVLGTEEEAPLLIMPIGRK